MGKNKMKIKTQSVEINCYRRTNMRMDMNCERCVILNQRNSNRIAFRFRDFRI